MAKLPSADLVFNHAPSQRGNSDWRSVNQPVSNRSLSSFGLQRPVSIQIHGHQLPMDLSAVRTIPLVAQEEDEWDTDGFVIPSLGIGDSEQSKPYVPDLEPLNSSAKAKKEEDIYLGPHRAPPS